MATAAFTVKNSIPVFVPIPKTRLYKSGLASLMIGPFIGVIIAVFFLFNHWVTWFDVLLLGLSYFVFALGVTAGLHRLFTHRSYKVKPWLHVILCILGIMALEGTITSWCACHREHHLKSDEEGDPHSPVLRGFWDAHMWCWFRPTTADPRRYVPDLLKDPVVQKIDSQIVFWWILSFTYPFVLGLGYGVLTSANSEQPLLDILIAGVRAFVWGGLVRIFLVHHFTWIVNSAGHLWGERPYETMGADNSRNITVWILLLFTLGELWHCTHHLVQWSVRHGTNVLNDPTYGVITIFKKLGWARDLKLPDEEMLRSHLKDVHNDPMTKVTLSVRIINLWNFLFGRHMKQTV